MGDLHRFGAPLDRRDMPAARPYPCAHVLDLTSRLGDHALAQLGRAGLDGAGIWRDLAMSDHPRAHRVDWQRPGAGPAEVPAPDVGALIVLIGPGARSRLDEVIAMAATFSRPVMLLLTPSAIVEELHLKARRAALPPNAECHRLPSSDPATLWLVLLEQITQVPQPPHGEGADSSTGERPMSSNLKQSMEAAMTINGALAAALVDLNSGMCLATAGGGMNLDLAAAGNTEVVRAKLKTVESLGLRRGIEDILITLVDQYHLIRLIPTHPGLFLYLVLDKAKGNLALARYKLGDIERAISV